MLPYQISCVYRFVNNILYRLSEYRLKVISVQHYWDSYLAHVQEQTIVLRSTVGVQTDKYMF